jgi:DNA-directed RNA polymerase subunit RPC12/RpoP
MEEKLILCTRCGKKYPSGQMRYFQDVKNIMCVNCVEKIKHPTHTKEELAPAAPKDAKPKRTRYKCKRCKHTFQLKENFNKVCPFCSSTTLEVYEWNSDLDGLISDSTQRMYDN